MGCFTPKNNHLGITEQRFSQFFAVTSILLISILGPLGHPLYLKNIVNVNSVECTDNI